MSIDAGRVSATHRTPFHQQIVAQGWDAEIATRAYYEYAMERLAAGCFDSAAAPNAIYGLARTAALLKNRATHGPLRAMHLYDLTLRLDPSHALAANELGVMLSHNGRFHEAEHVLLHAVNCGDCPESWENLATVYGRLGKPDEYQWAMQRARAEPPDAATPEYRIAAKPVH